MIHKIHRCLPVNVAEFSRTLVLKNICERLLVNRSIVFQTCRASALAPHMHHIMKNPAHRSKIMGLKCKLKSCKIILFGNFSKYKAHIICYLLNQLGHITDVYFTDQGWTFEDVSKK